MPAVAGVDGTRGGWIMAIWDGAGIGLHFATTWAALPLAGLAAVGVDMPIGLSAGPPRACDTAARARLPARRKPSVFPAPRRYMLGRSHAEANAEGKRRDGRGLSVQSWHIMGKIAELDAALTPCDQNRIHEVHPELVFDRLGGGAILPPKRRQAGRAARLALLAEAGVPDPAALLHARERGGAKADDILDAIACALTAARIRKGQARRLPDAPECDSRGLHMEIWF